MTREYAIARLQLIADNSREGTTFQANDWAKGEHDRTYFELRNGKKTKRMGYLNNVTGKYVPETYGNLERNTDFDGAALKVKVEEIVEVVAEVEEIQVVEKTEINEEIVEMLVDNGETMDILEVCCKLAAKIGFENGHELRSEVLEFLKSKSTVKISDVAYGYYDSLGLHWFSTNASDEWTLDDQQGLAWSASTTI